MRQLGYHTAAFVFDDPAMRAEIGDAFATPTVPGRQVALYPKRGGKVATFWVHRSDADIRDASAGAAAMELMRMSASGIGGWILKRQISGDSVIARG